MRKKYTRLVKWPDGYALFLSIGVQSFGIGNSLPSRSQGTWTQDMLAAALAKIEL